MAAGYRLVLRELFPGVPFHGRTVADYEGPNDGVVTEPSSSVSDAGGMFVTANLFRAAVVSVFSGLVNAGGNITPRISVLPATWDEGDVLETIDTESVLQAGTAVFGVRVPDPPVSLVWYRVSALTTGAELAYEDINAAALDVSLQEA